MADGQVVSRNVYDGFDHVVSPNTGGSGTMKSAKFTFDPLDRTASKTADGRTTTFNYLGLSGSRWGWRPPRWRSPREGRGVDGGRPAAVRGGGAGAAAAGPADRRRGDDRAVARHQGRAAALRPPEPERLGPRFRDPRLQVPARDGLFVLAAQLRAVRYVPVERPRRGAGLRRADRPSVPAVAIEAWPVFTDAVLAEPRPLTPAGDCRADGARRTSSTWACPPRSWTKRSPAR